MNVVVLASASRISGAKTIYLQFISHLSKYIGNDKYYIFVDPSVPQPEIEGVTYIQEADHSWKRRIAWDFRGFKAWTKKMGIKPDVVVSLQNTSVKCDCKQVVYYHQSLPLYPNKWNPLKAEERKLFLYKYIYPWFVKSTVKKDALIVVQIPFIKKRFVKTFKHHEENVYVLFPDIPVEISEHSAEDEELKGKHYFIYPAIGINYKQHCTIVNAVKIAKAKYPELADKIKVVFTLDKEKDAIWVDYVKKKGCEANFEFTGHIDYKKLMQLVKNSHALLFPSTIESLGLPLVEAATMGKAIVVADKDYAREVLLDYSGVTFLPFDAYEQWAEEIVKLYRTYKTFAPIKQRESSWGEFFKLIKDTLQEINNQTINII